MYNSVHGLLLLTVRMFAGLRDVCFSYYEPFHFRELAHISAECRQGSSLMFALIHPSLQI